MFIPQLLQPLILWQKDFQFLPEAPILSQLLRTFDLVSSSNIKGIDASFFASLGLGKNKELPIAHYRYQAHTGCLNHQKLLCADPVHLEVGLNDLTLTQQITDLTNEEVRQCIEALNHHFKQDGLEFISGSNSQWYLISSIEATMITTPLELALRKNIAHFLPESTNLNWKTIQNEAQMILHTLPFYQNREALGLPTLNSLWFYGGGQPENFDHNVSMVHGGSEGRGKFFSIAANCDFMALAENSSDLLKAKTGRHAVILDQLMIPAIYDDIEKYQQQLTYLEAYIQPLIKAWESGDIELIIDSCNGKLITPKKVPSWKFWARKKCSLTEIAKVKALQ